MKRRSTKPIMPGHWALPLIAMLLLHGCGATKQATTVAGTFGSPPNILFIIMDDVGIDQMKIFGYGGSTPPRTPNIKAIARAGVRFRNVWAMPECSPSRAIFFEGRYPLRTNVLNAILNIDLANSQVSPFEATTPRVLRQRGYESGLFGKFHLAGPDNNPFGNGTPRALGWDFFYGFLDGGPRPIDTTAGGVAPSGTYSCGFVPPAAFPGGADVGACYFADHRQCTEMAKSSKHSTPGLTCLEIGGLFVPKERCQSPPPGNLNFSQVPQAFNGYYVSPLFIIRDGRPIEEIPPTDPRARGYRTIIETNAAIDWITTRRPDTPWMATVSYSSAHAPYQQPPTALLPAGSVDRSGFNCSKPLQQRVLSNQMIESMDTEIGRLLVEVGLATRTPDGGLRYRPEATKTMIIIIGDNGTYAPGVKAPFDSHRSKGYVYQTGVWVPLVVAGPLVNGPDRDVNQMVNIADLFELFGEIAGVEVRNVVPPSHVLDSVSMLPYLINPKQESLRKTSFAQTANNITANGVRPQPCVIESVNTCVQVFTTQIICEDSDGTWYGAGADAEHGGPDGLTSCCQVKTQYDPDVDILPDAQMAIRNDRFKLVQKTVPNCTTNQEDVLTEFYEINQSTPLPKIDRKNSNLLTSSTLPPQGLNREQSTNFKALYAELQALLNSQPDCPGDGNLDLLVNEKDLQDWAAFSQANGQSSWYDFNFDGLTNEADESIIKQHLGTQCRTRR